MTEYQFVIADDHPLFRDALKQIVAARYPGSEIDEAGTLDEVESRLSASDDTDLVLLDLATRSAWFLRSDVSKGTVSGGARCRGFCK